MSRSTRWSRTSLPPEPDTEVPTDPKFGLIDSVRRDIAIEARAALAVRSLTPVPLATRSPNRSATPAPRRRRVAAPEPASPELWTGAIFLSLCAVALLAGMTLSFGLFSVVSMMSALLVA